MTTTQSDADRATTTFEAFYRRRYPDAVRLAYVLTGNAGDAEDVAQDALIRVRERFAALDEPWPYTRSAVVNGARSHLRGRRRERARLELVAVTHASSVPLQASELLDVIDRLPYRQKAVVVLRYYVELSEAEIAEVLRCRPGTVKSLASRALSKLAEEIKR